MYNFSLMKLVLECPVVECYSIHELAFVVRLEVVEAQLEDS